MKTKHKIALARAAYHLIHFARAAVGKHDVGVFVRNGANYELDLAQGIDFSIFLLGSFEPTTTAALESLVKPGFCIFDIGANVGAHTLTLARLAGAEGKVVACEPTNFAFAKLCRNINLNPDLVQRVAPIKCFLSGPDRSKAPEAIYSGWPLVGGKDLHPKHLGHEEDTGDAPCRSVDEIVASLRLPRVDVVKMDVDGFECDVLAGAIETMRSDRPIFVMEVTPYVLAERGGSFERFLRYFNDLEYRFFDVTTSKTLPMTEKELSAMIGDGASVNVIARAPREYTSILRAKRTA
jgi:FkbM family methyltransferase